MANPLTTQGEQVDTASHAWVRLACVRYLLSRTDLNPEARQGLITPMCTALVGEYTLGDRLDAQGASSWGEEEGETPAPNFYSQLLGEAASSYSEENIYTKLSDFLAECREQLPGLVTAIAHAKQFYLPLNQRGALQALLDQAVYDRLKANFELCDLDPDTLLSTPVPVDGSANSNELEDASHGYLDEVKGFVETVLPVAEVDQAQQAAAEAFLKCYKQATQLEEKIEELLPTLDSEVGLESEVTQLRQALVTCRAAFNTGEKITEATAHDKLTFLTGDHGWLEATQAQMTAAVKKQDILRRCKSELDTAVASLNRCGNVSVLRSHVVRDVMAEGTRIWRQANSPEFDLVEAGKWLDQPAVKAALAVNVVEPGSLLLGGKPIKIEDCIQRLKRFDKLKGADFYTLFLEGNRQLQSDLKGIFHCDLSDQPEAEDARQAVLASVQRLQHLDHRQYKENTEKNQFLGALSGFKQAVLRTTPVPTEAPPLLAATNPDLFLDRTAQHRFPSTGVGAGAEEGAGEGSVFAPAALSPAAYGASHFQDFRSAALVCLQEDLDTLGSEKARVFTGDGGSEAFGKATSQLAALNTALQALQDADTGTLPDKLQVYQRKRLILCNFLLKQPSFLLDKEKEAVSPSPLAKALPPVRAFQLFTNALQSVSNKSSRYESLLHDLPLGGQDTTHRIKGELRGMFHDGVAHALQAGCTASEVSDEDWNEILENTIQNAQKVFDKVRGPDPDAATQLDPDKKLTREMAKVLQPLARLALAIDEDRPITNAIEEAKNYELPQTMARKLRNTAFWFTKVSLTKVSLTATGSFFSRRPAEEASAVDSNRAELNKALEGVDLREYPGAQQAVSAFCDQFQPLPEASLLTDDSETLKPRLVDVLLRPDCSTDAVEKLLTGLQQDEKLDGLVEAIREAKGISAPSPPPPTP